MKSILVHLQRPTREPHQNHQQVFPQLYRCCDDIYLRSNGAGYVGHGSNGNVTTYSHADSYNDTTPAGNTNAYLTKITHPKTKDVDHVQSFSYAFSDGQLMVTTDENGKQTTYHYDDSPRRPTETDAADGGKTTISYNDNAPNPSVTTTKKIDPSKNLVST